MANKLNIDTVELTSTLRAAPANGAPSSADYNDSQREALTDLSAIASLVNNTILPLLNALSEDAGLPVTSPVGIEGRTIFSDTSDTSDIFFDSLAGEPLDLAASIRLLRGMLTNAQTKLSDMGVEVTALQTRLASTNQNDIAQALQNFSDSLNQLTNTTNSNNAQLSDHNTKLNKFQTKRQTTGAVTGGARAQVTLTWPQAFDTANYTVSLSMFDNSAAGTGLRVERLRAITTTDITVQVINDAGGPLTGTIHATARLD